MHTLRTDDATGGLRTLIEHTSIMYCVVMVNVATLAVYGWDKFRAVRRRRRVPEWILLCLAGAGGSLGALFAMRLFRHKTLHLKFKVGVPLVLLLQMAGLLYLHM